MKIAIGGMQKNEMDFAIKKVMPEVETVITVSYTHLDVYKRQSLISS